MPSIFRAKAVRSVGFNFAGAVVPLILTLFTVPIYLHYVGPARYGVVLVAWSLLGYFGFMDLGLSRATTNALARLAHLDEADAKARVFWSSLIINGCLGAIGGLIMLLAGSYLFGHVMRIAPDVHDEAVACVPYIAMMLPIALMLGVGVGTSEAHESFGILNLIQMSGLILGQALPLLAVVRWGPSLLIIMPVMLGVRIVTFLAVTIQGMRVAGIKLQPIVDFGVVRKLMSFGGWVAVTNVVSPIMTNADQFVIGSMRAVGVIPFYAVPLNIISRTQIIPTTLTRTLFPIFSRIDDEDGAVLLAKTVVNLSAIMTVVYIVGIFLGAPFLTVWLGEKMAAEGGPVFQILCIGAWSNSLAFVLFSALQGQGRPRTVALIHSCEVVPYLVLLYLLVRSEGILGAAVAWTIRVTADALALSVAAKLNRKTFSALLPGAIFLSGAACVARIIGTAVLPAFLATAVFCFIFFVFIFLTNKPVVNALKALRLSLPSHGI